MYVYLQKHCHCDMMHGGKADYLEIIVKHCGHTGTLCSSFQAEAASDVCFMVLIQVLWVFVLNVCAQMQTASPKSTMLVLVLHIQGGVWHAPPGSRTWEQPTWIPRGVNIGCSLLSFRRWPSGHSQQHVTFQKVFKYLSCALKRPTEALSATIRNH